jgi:hypothetical protein
LVISCSRDDPFGLRRGSDGTTGRRQSGEEDIAACDKPRPPLNRRQSMMHNLRTGLMKNNKLRAMYEDRIDADKKIDEVRLIGKFPTGRNPLASVLRNVLLYV